MMIMTRLESWLPCTDRLSTSPATTCRRSTRRYLPRSTTSAISLRSTNTLMNAMFGRLRFTALVGSSEGCGCLMRVPHYRCWCHQIVSVVC